MPNVTSMGGLRSGSGKIFVTESGSETGPDDDRRAGAATAARATTAARASVRHAAHPTSAATAPTAARATTAAAASRIVPASGGCVPASP